MPGFGARRVGRSGVDGERGGVHSVHTSRAMWFRRGVLAVPWVLLFIDATSGASAEASWPPFLTSQHEPKRACARHDCCCAAGVIARIGDAFVKTASKSPDDDPDAFAAFLERLKIAPTPEGGATGLKWRDVGSRRPPGPKLKNGMLAEALQRKTVFSQEEWVSFGVQGLRADHFVKSGHSYFVPETEVAAAGGDRGVDVDVLVPAPTSREEDGSCAGGFWFSAVEQSEREKTRASEREGERAGERGRGPGWFSAAEQWLRSRMGADARGEHDAAAHPDTSVTRDTSVTDDTSVPSASARARGEQGAAEAAREAVGAGVGGGAGGGQLPGLEQGDRREETLGGTARACMPAVAGEDTPTAAGVGVCACQG